MNRIAPVTDVADREDRPVAPHEATPLLVLIHGLYSSAQEFALMARILKARGVDYECLAVPGYTDGDGPRAMHWPRWVETAGRALDARYGAGRPIVLGGLCVGGMLAAALALQPRRQTVLGLALLSPTFAYDGWSIGGWQRWRRVAYRLRIDRWIHVPERAPFGVKNEKTRAWIAQELAGAARSAVGPARLPLRGIRETERLHAWVAARLDRVPVPILVLHARDDELATVGSVERVLARSGAPGRLIVLEHSFHMITVDNDRQRVAHELADFVGAPPRAPALPQQPPATRRSRAASTTRRPPNHSMEPT